MKVRHLVEKSSGGRPIFYWQPSADLRMAGWQAMRLPDDRPAAIAKAEGLNLEVDAWRRGEVSPNAPAAAALRGKRAAAGTVEALIADYKASRFWLKLAQRTRDEYAWALELIATWAGDMPARGITPPAVQAFYAAQLRRVEGSGRNRRVIETPAKAAAVIRVLRLLLGVGERLGYLPAGSNPAAKPGLELRRQREPLLWSAAAVRHMAAAADRLGWRSIGTAILLNEWLGQREADILGLPPWSVDHGALMLQQGKTRRRVALPVHLVPHLVARLQGEAERARQEAVAGVVRASGFSNPLARIAAAGAVVQLRAAQAADKGRPVLLRHESTGREWNRHTFGHVFAEVRVAAAAGIPADEARGLPALPAMPECARLRFMELRHTAVTRLHEAGVDELGIAGITGHTPGSVRAILDRHYLVRTAKAAEGAFRKRLAAEGGEHG